MKTKDLVPLFKEMLPSLPGFAFHKRLLLRAPIGDVLHAVHVDTTGWDKDGFNVDVFVMPLCVPETDVHFTFGRRVDDPDAVWTMTMPNVAAKLSRAIHEQAVPFFSRSENLLDFVDLVACSRNPHAPKAAAYALARMGQDARAIAMIDKFLPTLNLDVGWEKVIFDESTALRHMLLTAPDEAHRKLEEWEGDTIRALGLERFR